MMEKIFIVGLIVCSFFVVSASTVIAAEETHTVTDDTGDVFDDSGNVVNSSLNINVNNIDIREITYSKEGKKVTLTLKVWGNIEDKGNINDVESGIADNYVAYILILYTSVDSYTIYYLSNECRIAYQSTGEIENISDFSKSGSTLAVPFDLLSDDETYDTIEAMTEYYKISGEDHEYLTDMAPDLITLEVTADGPSEGTIGESIHFSGETNNGTSPYNWSWDFDDGETSYKQNPTHSYTKAGAYEITLYVTDADGNPGSNSITLTIEDSGTSNGGDHEGNRESESSNSGLILFVVIIAIIAIAGIAIVIYIIRR